MRGNEYELLPTGSQFNNEAEFEPPRSRRQWYKQHPRALLGAAILIAISVVIFTFDVVYLQARRFQTDDELFSSLWPIAFPNQTNDWQNENNKAMRALLTCMRHNACRPNQTSIVLLSSHHFAESIEGRTLGEDIWAASVLLSLQELGYTSMFCPNNDELIRIYPRFPELVKVIILEAERAEHCFEDKKCIKHVERPLGIPAWKMLSFHFWAGPSNPLGAGWTLSPEDYARISPSNKEQNVYLGYSIESTCKKIEIPPSAERPLHAYVLAKYPEYFIDENYPWTDVSFEHSPISGLSVIAGLRGDDKHEKDIPPGLVNLGSLNQKQFYKELGNSRVLIGIGKPPLSPSPYDALCMGVPFINPILSWNHDEPDDRTKWETQHEALKYENPPYVYNVKQDDVQGFWDAIQAALNNPINRYIVPSMTMDALKSRVADIVERDWKGKAQALLLERQTSGKGQLFDI
ncbi:hypothetical protein C8J56DRAFT_1157886 [Mycena floridula]|nr:hypothetical protein C8J56DRAFT_1157886 [Mycena floridula]